MKVLVIAAHLDDEVLGCGGTILKLKEEGHQVYVLYTCSRAYDNSLDDALVRREEKCAEKVCGFLNVDDFWFLGLHDEQLDHKVIDVVVPIEKKIREIKPDAVFTTHRGDNHQDHRAVFDATMIAARGYSNFNPKKVYSYEILSSTEQSAPHSSVSFSPNTYMNIEKYIEKKLKAMSFYENEVFSFPHPRSLEAIKTLSMYRGISCNMKYAEAFILVRELLY